MKNVRINTIGPKLVEVECKSFWGGIADCVKALPELQEKYKIRQILVVIPRLYLILE